MEHLRSTHWNYGDHDDGKDYFHSADNSPRPASASPVVSRNTTDHLLYHANGSAYLFYPFYANLTLPLETRIEPGLFVHQLEYPVECIVRRYPVGQLQERT